MRSKLILLSIFVLFLSCSGSKHVVPDTPNRNADALPSIPAGEVVTKSIESADSCQKWNVEVLPNDLKEALDVLVSQNAELLDFSQVGLCVYDLTDERFMYCLGERQRMRPASCQKLITAITTLDVRGGEYRYVPQVEKPGEGWCWDDKITSKVPWKDDSEKSVNEVLQPMMKNSDNMLAESMFALIGKSDVELLMQKEGLNPKDYIVADGSGLSLYNYVSPLLLVRFLRYAWKKDEIRSYLYEALPVAGVDGTLKKRMKNTKAEGNVRAKTGTVEGVSSLSGYATASNGHVLAFSIINQGVAKTAQGKDFQDKVCLILVR